MSRAAGIRAAYEAMGAALAAGTEGLGLPCRKGCDGCCHGTDPALTEDDRALLSEGLAALPQGERQRIAEAALRRLSQPPEGRPCPLLSGGSCRLYAHRPIACRLHGLTETASGRIYGCALTVDHAAAHGLRLPVLDTLAAGLYRTDAPRVRLMDFLARS